MNYNNETFVINITQGEVENGACSPKVNVIQIKEDGSMSIHGVDPINIDIIKKLLKGEN